MSRPIEPGPPRPFLPYEIPLGDGETARLVLPAVMTKEEADRICGVIQALAFGGGVVTQ